MFFAGQSGLLNHLQLVSHELALVSDEKQNSLFGDSQIFVCTLIPDKAFEKVTTDLG